jgi:hypothetical protein
MAPRQRKPWVVHSTVMTFTGWYGLRKNFPPGRYVLHCEMPVTNTDLTHADLGMVQEIETKD